MDEDQPLRIKLEFRKNGEMRYSFKVEEYRCDVARLLPVLKFLKTFTNAKELKITISNQGEKELQGDIPENMQKSLVDDNYYRLVESLAFIQEKSGYILRISKDSIIKADEIRTIFVVENAIKHGMINDFEFDIDAKLNRIQALHIIQKIKKGKNDFSYEYELPPFKILGREVSLGPGRIISDNFECKEDVDKLYEKLIGSKEDTAVLKLRGKGECILHWFS